MFYAKLALQNIKQNKQAFMPFLISMIFLGALNTLMLQLINESGIAKLPGGETYKSLFTFGAAIIIIFSVIFSIYTSSILNKQRKKELGLYNILGLGKRELVKLTFFEMLISFVITAVLGILSGVVFSRLSYLVLKKMIDFKNFTLVFDLNTLILSVLVMGLLFVCVFIISLFSILKSDPIKFLQASKEGEREPKAKWLLALIGFISLGYGYYMSLTIKSPVTAVVQFFVAVLLVIVGTYLVFTAGSIVILKLLRKNERYYYNNKHFIPLSGMIYRMKQNAVGLASICILSTMVLVTIATTASLYFGKNDQVKQNYPYEMMITTTSEPQKLEDSIKTYAKEQNVKLTNFQNVKLSEELLFTRQKSGKLTVEDRGTYNIDNANSAVNVVLLTLDEYNKATKSKDILARSSDALVYTNDKFDQNTLKMTGANLNVTKQLTSLPKLGIVIDGVTPIYVVVVKDQAAYDSLVNKWYPRKEDADYKIERSHLNFDFNLNGEAKRLNFIRGLSSYLARNNKGYYLDAKDSYRQSIQTFNGSFFFIGIVLGTAFLLATVMIIYCKQVSEGMDDRDRFVILQKVGMDKSEVKRVIHSQIMMVFIFPLAMAIIHIAFAFPLIKKLLLLFSLSNWHLYLLVTVIVILVFTVIYYLVYQLTARVYYRLIER